MKKASQMFRRYFILLIVISTIFLSGCKVQYSFTGASISPEVKTVSVDYFQNLASLVYPQLSSKFTEALKERFITQTSLNAVKEYGEFLRVGSSKVHKTNVRVVAATNVNVPKAIEDGKFREDLYYRLNTVPIQIPPLRERSNDIPLLFRKFASDFADKYRMPPISLNDDARRMIMNYKWPGNIRQLKNITEQISIIEESREVTADVLMRYLPDYSSIKLPALYDKKGFVDEQTFASEREILYKILFDMRNDVNELKKLVLDLMHSNPDNIEIKQESAKILNNLYNNSDSLITPCLLYTSEAETV